jgi:hypothetical protein
MRGKELETLSEINDWIQLIFPDYDVKCVKQDVINPIDKTKDTIYMWAISNDCLIICISFNNLTYVFNGIFSIKKIDPNTGEFITEEFSSTSVSEMKDDILKRMKKYRDDIATIKYDNMVNSLHSKDDGFAIDFVNKIIEEKGV